MTITLVAAIGANGVIGRDGSLPWRLPEDLAHFKRLTLGHVLIMGRRTYESIGLPLPGRTTIVITTQPAWTADGVLVANALDEALALGAALDSEVFVVGGADVYEQALPVADRMVLSRVDQAPAGDRWFPEVDWSDWQEDGRDPRPGFVIMTYRRAM